MNIITKEIAECIGLWLAEGDTKSKGELTFTNNCLDLIFFFEENISKIYYGKNKPRLYIYSPSDRQLFFNLNQFKKINFYIDERANRPYYTYRLGDATFIRKWKNIIQGALATKKYDKEILRGIFAGEGYVKLDLKNHAHRSIKIASGDINVFLESLLTRNKIKFKFNKSRRQYEISGNSLKLANNIELANLHPEKSARFNKLIKSYKEKHYSPNELKSLIHKRLENNIFRTKDLSKILDRSELRILEILAILKKENKIDNLRLNNKTYWGSKALVNKQLKEFQKEILINLFKLKTITLVSNKLNFGSKAIRKRLRKMKEDGLVEKNKEKWKVTPKGLKILGIDESGSEI